MESLKKSLESNPVFKVLQTKHLDFLAAHMKEENFKTGKFLFKTGEPAEEFYLVVKGKVALEVYSPPKGPLTILTVGTHNILGWSWLYPPYTWHFDAKALSDTIVYTFDAIKIRQECRKDYEFGYLLTNCFGQIMMQRLAATRLQLLDVFGTDSGYHNYMDL